MKSNTINIEELKNKSKLYRKTIIEMIYKAKVGHPGGSLSCIDILNVLYNTRIDRSEENKDRLILSKGHVTPSLFSVFMDLGYIEKSEINTFRQINSRLQGHPDRNKIKEIDANTGLLGQGLSIGVGAALAKKLKNDNDHNVYVIIGDGEMHEGQIWEALMEGAHYKLNNLIVFLDYNKLSSKGNCNEVMNLEPIHDRIKSFNWHIEEINGNDIEEILQVLEKIDSITDKPKFIIANTIKGKGVSFMENNPKWHSGGLNDEQYRKAIEELN